MPCKEQQVHIATILEFLLSKGEEKEITLKQLIKEAQVLLYPLIEQNAFQKKIEIVSNNNRGDKNILA
ncbi:hypothetical protein [Lederbergia panacisoli]|uniref:hypothetical protein n=1 Tax=Lederbergia panacisoli TaxID=1255251 RepID=UPI00214C11BE|nr:hypothetical protein [Lederbergia panacisoli]MCR2821438.1 hypothetical protein [Lederbergia panacisoli]